MDNTINTNQQSDSQPRIADRHRRSERRTWLLCIAVFRTLTEWLYGLVKAFQSTYIFEQTQATARQRFSITVRLVPVALVFLSLMIPIAAHIYKLQITDHEKFLLEAERLCSTTKTSIGARGCIYTSDKVLLAGNYIQKDVFVEPKKFKEESLDDTYRLLAAATERPVEEIRDMFFEAKNKDIRIVISDHVDAATARHIQSQNYPLTQVVLNSPKKNSSDKPHQATYSVIFTLPHLMKINDYRPTIDRIGAAIGLTPEQIDKAVKGSRGINRPKQIKIATGIDFEKGLVLEQELKKIPKTGVGAFQIVSNYTRLHPCNGLASNLVGVTDPAGGLSGIEKLFDDILQPKDGKIISTKDGKGHAFAFAGKENYQFIPPTNGSNIFLTIDSNIQGFAEKYLAEALPTVNPDRAYVVMMNPRTGAIMALAQSPTFDPNRRDEVQDTNAFGFLCLSETFEPGSIMKGVSLACGVSQGFFNINTVFYCERGFWREARLHDTHNNENLSVSEIIMHSSNIGTAKAAIAMGPDNLYKGLNAFGFGKRTGIGFYPLDGPAVTFKEEATGIFRPRERWDGLSISRFPIGQGISVTPFQMVQAYCAIANGGVMMQPYIVDHIVRPDGSIVRSVPRVKKIPINHFAAEQMVEALKTVVSPNGTAKRAAIEGYTVAGKTGTSEIWNSATKHYDTSKVVASFIGFAPADNPKFVLLVTFVNPKPKKHGGTIAGPVFRKIATETLQYLHVPPEVDPLEEERKNDPSSKQGTAEKR